MARLTMKVTLKRDDAKSPSAIEKRSEGLSGGLAGVEVRLVMADSSYETFRR